MVYLARRGTHLPIWVAEHKGCVGRLPQALIKRPPAFPVPPFLRLGGKLAITNDVNHALDVSSSILGSLPISFRPVCEHYRASGRVPLGVFWQTLHLGALKDPQRGRGLPLRT